MTDMNFARGVRYARLGNIVATAQTEPYVNARNAPDRLISCVPADFAGTLSGRVRIAGDSRDNQGQHRMHYGIAQAYDCAGRSIKMNAYQFFLKHARYSHDPKTETAQQGRIRCARLLAKVEREAREGGFSYHWSVDQDINSSEFSDEQPAWDLWQCVMLNSAGRPVGSLHGIDFGRDGNPWGDPYRRVVEAELAIDGLTNEPQ